MIWYQMQQVAFVFMPSKPRLEGVSTAYRHAVLNRERARYAIPCMSYQCASLLRLQQLNSYAPACPPLPRLPLPSIVFLHSLHSSGERERGGEREWKREREGALPVIRQLRALAPIVCPACPSE